MAEGDQWRGSAGSTRSLAMRTVAITSLLFGFELLCPLFRQMLEPGIAARLADSDFANYWTGAHLAAAGRIDLIFGQNEPYLAHLRSVMGPELPWHNWSYPPHYLLLMMPLALVGYKAGIVLFLGGTGLFFAAAARAFMGPGRNMLALAAVSPLVVVNVWTVQNGFLTSGLILAALASRDRRPVIAGICLGLLSIKPQLAMLLPLLMVLERRWAVLAIAALTTIIAVVVSILAFGTAAWDGYLGTVIPYQARVMMELGGSFLAMMPSAFGALRLVGVASEQALHLHLVLAALAFATVCTAMLLVRDGQRRSVLLIVATFIITPYSLNYDMGCLGAALALFVATEEREGWSFGGGERVLLAVAMLLPILMMKLGPMLIPCAPVVLLAVFALMLARAGLPALLLGRMRLRAAA